VPTTACHDPDSGAVPQSDYRDENGRTRPALVALIGPPNSGKTTLYNQLTGLRQKVANYPGVTVEKHLGRVKLPDQGEVTLIDLPGVNGFSARTLDERVTRDVLEGRIEGLPVPDAVVLVVDSTRLEPHLMLVDPVMELGLPTLLVLNMADELERRGGKLDDAALAAQLGLMVVRANARAGVGVEAVQRFLSSVSHPSANGNGTKPAPPPEPKTVARVAAPMKRLELPVVDVFVTRRGRVRVVSQRAGYMAPLPSKWTERLDSILLH
jgi:ferrous iron transport protein B